MKAFITNKDDPSKDRERFQQHKDEYYSRIYHAMRRAILVECDAMGVEHFEGCLQLDAQTITEACAHVAALFSAETPHNIGDDPVAAAAFRERASRYIGKAMANALEQMAEMERAEKGSMVRAMNIGFAASDGSAIERAAPGEPIPE